MKIQTCDQEVDTDDSGLPVLRDCSTNLAIKHQTPANRISKLKSTLKSDSENLFSTIPNAHSSKPDPAQSPPKAPNKFKRPQDYQQKYQKLEQNLRKFSQTIRSSTSTANSTEMMSTMQTKVENYASFMGFQTPCEPLPKYELSVQADRTQTLQQILFSLQEYLAKRVKSVEKLSQQPSIAQMSIEAPKTQTLTEPQTLCLMFEQHMHQVSKLLQALINSQKPATSIIPFLSKTLQEAYRLEPNDMLHALINSVKLLKFQSATYLLQTNPNQLLKAFKKWKSHKSPKHQLSRIINKLQNTLKLKAKAKAFLKLLPTASQVQPKPLLKELICDRTAFDQCLESDALLFQQVCSSLYESFQADIVTYQEEEVRCHNSQTTQQLEAHLLPSLLHTCIQSNQIKLVSQLLGQRAYTEPVDKPYLSAQQLKDLGSEFGCILVPLQAGAVLRIYLKGQLTNQSKELAVRIQTELQAFITRVREIRSQLGELHQRLMEARDRTGQQELERKVFAVLFQIQQSLYSGDQSQFLLTVRQLIQEFLASIWDTFELKQLTVNGAKVFQDSQVQTPRLQTLGLEEGIDIQFTTQEEQILATVTVTSHQAQLTLCKLVEFEQGAQVPPEIAACLLFLTRAVQPVVEQGLLIHSEIKQQILERQALLQSQKQSNLLRQFLRAELKHLARSESPYQLLEQTIRKAFEQVLEAGTVLQSQVFLNEVISIGDVDLSDTLVSYSDAQLLTEEIATEPESKIDGAFGVKVKAADLLDLEPTTCNTEQGVKILLPVRSDECLLAVAVVIITPNLTQEELKTTSRIALLCLCQQLFNCLQQSLQDRQYHVALEQERHRARSLQTDIELMQAIQEKLVLKFTRSGSLMTLCTSLRELTEYAIPQVRCLRAVLVQDGEARWELPLETQRGESGLEVVFGSGDRKIHLLLEAQSSANLSQFRQNVEVFQQIISPYVSTAVASLTQSLLSVQQEHLPRVLLSLFKKSQSQYAAHLLLVLRKFQASQVPIFTRLDSFPRVMKLVMSDERNQRLSISMDMCNNSDEIMHHQLSLRAQCQQIYTEIFKTLNRVAQESKQQAFAKYKQIVLNQIQKEREQYHMWSTYQASKQQRKAFSIMCRLTQLFSRRANFSKWAVYATSFRRLNTPTCRKLQAARCLQHRYSHHKKLLGFQKLKGEACKRQWRDFSGLQTKDRDFMLSLQKELIAQIPLVDTMRANVEVQTVVTATLEKAMIYLQQTLLPEGLDAIVCSVVNSTTSSKYRAYLFNKSGGEADDEEMQDFSISVKKDIIMQMLQKSRTMFNFSNVSNSLLELYQTQFGLTPEPDIYQRMLLLRKSKSALFCPLLLSGKGDLIGTLELYRFYGQIFDVELEQRIGHFASQLQDVCSLFVRMRHTQLQICDLKQDLALTNKPVNSLTQLMSQTQKKGVQQLGASFFQCYLLSEGMAYFYQQQQNVIYSFDHEGSVIDEVMQMQECVLELQSADIDSQTTTCHFDSSVQSDHILPPQSHMTLRRGNLKALNGTDGFCKLYYYPVLGPDNATLRAIFEVGYKKAEQAPEVAYNQSVQSLLKVFQAHLVQTSLRIRQFLNKAESICDKNFSEAKQRMFMRWKQTYLMQKRQEEFEERQSHTIMQTQQCLDEYMSNLEIYDLELKKLADQREELEKESTGLKQDQTMKFKLLGACMLALNKLTQRKNVAQKRALFQKWRSNATIGKVVETAFNKMLELNYRHAQTRFSAASFLLKKACNRRLKKVALDNILTFARMTHLSVGGGQIGHDLLAFNSGFKSARTNGTRSSQKTVTGRHCMSSENMFSNIAGPFQKTKLQPNYPSTIVSQLQSQMSEEPICTNINVQPRLKGKHEKLKGSQKRLKESSSMAMSLVESKIRTTKQQTRKSSAPKSVGKSAPQTGRIIIP